MPNERAAAPRELLELLASCEDIDAFFRALEESPRRDALESVAREHRPQLDAIAVMMRAQREQLGGEGDAIARVRALFDKCVGLSEAASVAWHSLGDEARLRAATDEVVALLSAWGLVHPRADVLQIGCGVGRFEAAIAARVRRAVGVDVSPKMIEAARRRCDGRASVELQVTGGRDLLAFDDASFDLVYAVDSFPYLVAADDTLAARHVAEAARVLRANGELVVLNWSYRGDLARDIDDAQRAAAAHGFAVTACGERPFVTWDGAVFRMRKR